MPEEIPTEATEEVVEQPTVESPEAEPQADSTSEGGDDAADAAGDDVEEEFTPVALPTEEPKSDGLVELPDGRRVAPEKVVEEYKSLKQDYTRKSQALAEYEKTKDLKPWEDPNWNPKSDSEAVSAIYEHVYNDVVGKITAEQQAKAQQTNQVNERVNAEMNAIKEVDPSVDEEKVFAFANENNLSSAVTAYNLMKKMEMTEKRTEKRVLKNLKSRSSDAVSTDAAATAGDAPEMPDGLSLHEKAMYALRMKNI